jgi:antitoxin YefM
VAYAALGGWFLEARMVRVSFSAFRRDMAGLMDEVVASGEALVVTRRGRGGVVVMSEEAFAGWEETMHLLRSPANAAWLLASVGEADGRSLKIL